MFVNSDKLLLSSDFYVTEFFHFNETLFIGGIKESSRMNKKFKISKGLKGAIQKVELFFIIIENLSSKLVLTYLKANIDNLYLNDIRMNAIEIGAINRYEGFPCNSTGLCQNGGVCIPLVNNFKCNF